MSIAKKLMSPLALAMAFACAGLALTSQAGCVGGAQGRYAARVTVRSEPPAPRVVYVEPRSGYVWVDGRWVWNDYNGDWVWYDGYWVPEQTGYYYVAGRWNNTGNGYVWVHPRWVSRADNHVTIRVTDHSRPTRVRVRTNTGRHVPVRQAVPR